MDKPVGNICQNSVAEKLLFFRLAIKLSSLLENDKVNACLIQIGIFMRAVIFSVAVIDLFQLNKMLYAKRKKVKQVVCNI
jgi:hypothetical protein